MIKSGLCPKSSYVVLGVICLCALAFSQVAHDADPKVAVSSTARETERGPQVFAGSAKPIKAGEAAPRPMNTDGRRRPAPPIVSQESHRRTEPEKMEIFDGQGVMHVGRVIGSTAVATNGGNGLSRAAGELALGEPCSCDEDCAAVGDQCNIVQCIVRGVCSDDGTTPCSADSDCSGAPVCDQGSFLQRCDVVQLIDWPCDADADFCTEDRCADDGSATQHSVCEAQNDTSDGSGGPLSPCAKQCVGGPANGLRCTEASDCSQGACQITGGGGCDSAAGACFVGASLATAIGRCCIPGACTETDETTCTNGGGDWYRYRDPEEVEGDGNCLCPKYGSGVAPAGSDEGSSAPFGLVRPSGLICQVGSVETNAMVYCEDLDGDTIATNFCQNRCVGGDKAGELCEQDNPDCGLLGTCSIGGTFCFVSNGGSECGLCSISGAGCDADGLFPCGAGEGNCEFVVPQTCPPTNPGTCENDPCASNTIEGGCEDGFLNIGDDYALGNGSFLRLTQFRFRGGVTNLGEDIVFEFWDSTGTELIDAFAVNNLNRTGTHDWTIEVDCWPTCNLGQFEVPEQNPIIIPPTGYVVMRSPRTVGTINGAAAFWEQTDSPADVGTNVDTKSWVDDDPNGSVGTNVFIFELVGVKILDPAGACCDDEITCEDTLRWECGICSGADGGQLCASTLHDCPVGGLGGSSCQFNNWFGPISHDEIEFGGPELTLCNGISPCDQGACCDGESCTVTTQAACTGVFQGIATDCTPNCCPVDVPTGSDCACTTKTCVEIALSCLGGADEGSACIEDADCAVTDPGDPGVCGNQNLGFRGFFCDSDLDCEAGVATCVLQCVPAGTTILRHPFECLNDFGSPLEPRQDCDPALDDATACPPIPCTQDSDCPNGMFCDGGLGLCEDSLNMTCEQSFTGSFSVARNDTIAGDLFTIAEGETCTINTTVDKVGWFELITLDDPTPGDGSDDCFILTVGLCCTDPVLAPVWPFLSSFRNCPCLEAADVITQAPDFDIGDFLDGFGTDSKAGIAGRCQDGNYSATFTVPPGDYAYQINTNTLCAGSTIPCNDDNDCPGTACEVPNPDYSVHFTVESCEVAACCVDETCIITNELDCAAQQGNFLGGGSEPIVTCQAGACAVGVCCVDGQCRDDEFHDELAECEGQDGVYLGGVSCDAGPCPACPFDSPANCQQVQTVFAPVLPRMDRNPQNGIDGQTAQVVADDVKFGGNFVNAICWSTGFFRTPCCLSACVQNIDDTWEIRIYETDVTCDALPGTEIGMSTLEVLNKVEGAGQATGTWQYSGSLTTPIVLPNGGLAGDTYWFEVSGFGETGCEVRATWSRDDGNEHSAFSTSNNPLHTYSTDQVERIDVGFCENSGIGTPPDVLGACCICPGICQDNTTQRECVVDLGGVWTACGDCFATNCPGVPANDDCTSPFLVNGVPIDGSELLIVGENICATDDGPRLSDTGGCAGTLGGGADLHDDVWYAFVVECSGELSLHSCNDADYDQMIAVYDASSGCPLATNEEIACGDDTCGVGAGPSDVTVSVTSGQDLLIRVGGWNNEVPGGFIGNPRGNFTLHWSMESLVFPTTVFVDASAAGAEDGTSWADAFVSLQDALAASECFDEIWVAAATYHPDDGASVTPDDRTATFQLLNKRAIYGGFAGFETLREQRNPAINVTTLSGDLFDDDIGFTNNGENSFHVLTGSGTDATSILDGFTIRGGNSSDVGGGMLNISGSPTITNCKFIENSASSAGGAMSNQAGSAPTLTDCTFELNSAGSAGAMDNTGAGSDPTLTNCVFLNNAAVGAGGGGGAMNNTNADPILSNCTFIGNTALGAANGPGAVFNRSAANPLFVHCIFRSNEANAFGGVTDNFGAATPTFIGCVFRDNIAGADGGAIVLSETGTSVTAINCTFSGNSAAGSGGGIFHNRLAANTLTVTNCILFGNSDSGGTDESAQIDTVGGTGTTTVDYSLIQGLTGALNGTGNIGGDPMFDEVKGNLSILLGSPAIEAGDNTAVPADTADVDEDGDTVEPLPLDLDGNRRFVDELLTVDTGVGPAPIVDMGAFEAFRDCDGNGTPDDIELVVEGVIDCNANSNLDSCDIVECEGDLACADCNNNGVPDSCDIDSGTSDDCNDAGVGNDIPDECDIANCPLNFANPEDCDDCNNNEVLDECDIFGGTSLDDDGNGRPDECKGFDGTPDGFRGQDLIVGPGSSWGLDTNWEGDTLPDDTNSVILDSAVAAGSGRVAFVVDLDIPSSVASARLLGGTTLNVTGLADEDLTIGTDGIFVQGDLANNVPSSLNVSNDRVVDVPSGPITIGAAGEISSSNTGLAPPISLNAASIDIRNGSCECPPTNGGSLILDGTSMETTGDVVLVSPIGAVCTTPCALSRGGTTPPIFEATASFASIGGDLTMNAKDGAGGLRGGTTPPTFKILAFSEFAVTGNVTLNDGSGTTSVRGGTTPPILELKTSMMSAFNFTMNACGDHSFARGGTTPPILETQNAFMTIGGDFTVNGPDRSSAGRGGTTPPILKLFDTELTIEGDFNLNGEVDLQGSAGREAGPVTSLFLAGDFNNHSLLPAKFDLSTNLVTMGGTLPQTMEAAGKNRGAGTMDYDNNFFIGELEIASNADVTLRDIFDNDGLGQTVPEVQYVDTLTIEANGTLTIVDTTLFYSVLNNKGSLVTIGTGVARLLVPSLPEPCCINNDTCINLPGVDCTFEGGEIKGLAPACGGDPDRDGVPIGCDICPAGDDNLDDNGNGIPDACEIETPGLAPPPHDILKNRYISVDPRGTNQLNVGADLDIRLTLTSTLVNGVTAVGSHWWANAPDADCISVVGWLRPVSPPNWDACPTVHLTGCPIIPTSTYDIVAVAGGIVTDPPLTLATQAKPGVKWHGDCVGFFDGDNAKWTPPNLVVNADDFVAAIKTFQDPNADNATHLSVTDMVPNLEGEQINLIVNINDVFSIIKGFQGFEYPGTDLAQCP